MELKQLLKPELVTMDLKSTTKDDVIRELVEILDQNDLITDAATFREVVMERERISTTGIGMGVAIPHGKSQAVKEPAVIFGKSVKGIDYQSLDGEPSHLFFLIAVPEGSDNEHLTILSKLSRKLIHEDVREKLRGAKGHADIIEAFE